MNYKMIIAYDGSGYSGWQRNKNAKDTIQAKLDKTLSTYFNEKVDVIGAGRTDKGVHAKKMCANFHVKQKIDVKKAKNELNVYLPSDISIDLIEEVDDRFHARFNAKSKCYSYTFLKGYKGCKPVFDRKYVSVLQDKPSVDKMKEASEVLIGKHDFKGFSSDRTKKSTVRTIESIKIVEDEDRIVFYFVGDGFLYHMVRILVGTLVEVGLGKRSVKDVETVLQSKVRSEAGYLVPATGLFLEEVNY